MYLGRNKAVEHSTDEANVMNFRIIDIFNAYSTANSTDLCSDNVKGRSRQECQVLCLSCNITVWFLVWAARGYWVRLVLVMTRMKIITRSIINYLVESCDWKKNNLLMLKCCISFVCHLLLKCKIISFPTNTTCFSNNLLSWGKCNALSKLIGLKQIQNVSEERPNIG